PLPPGADTVVPFETAEELPPAGPGPARVRVTEPVPPGRNVGRRGEDVRAGTTILAAGRRLRPQAVGVLAPVGASPVAVARRPAAPQPARLRLPARPPAVPGLPHARQPGLVPVRLRPVRRPRRPPPRRPTPRPALPPRHPAARPQDRLSGRPGRLRPRHDPRR